jgi:hypothetical protein
MERIMAHYKRHSDRGGLGQLAVAVLILAGVAASGDFGKSWRESLLGEKQPVRVTTIDTANAKCAANTVDTIIGTIGCGSTKTGAHLNNFTFVSATKN